MSLEWSSAIVNSATAIAAWAGVGIAYYGLHTWKKQRIWEADVDLARKLLVASFNFQESISSVRRPIALDLVKHDKSSRDDGRMDGSQSAFAQAYETRWENHGLVRSELSALLVEADAIWGTELSEFLQPVFALDQELYGDLQIETAKWAASDAGMKDLFEEMLQDGRSTLHAKPNAELDVFQRDLTTAMEPIIGYLQPKLGRRQ